MPLFLLVQPLTNGCKPFNSLMKPTKRAHWRNIFGTLIRVFDAILKSDLRKPLPNLILYSLLIIGFFLISSTAHAQWVAGYTYKSLVRIDGSQVCGPTNHNNFPVMVNITGDFLKPAPAGLITSANGYDIIFTASDGTTILDHQIDHYVSSTGQLVAWVKIPALAPGTDTDLYMYYGNSGVVADPSTSNTWSGNFNTVYHFQSNNFNDATANAINGTDNGTTPVAAQIGEGRDFDGATSYIQTNNNLAATANNFTISLWFKADATTPGHMIWQGLASENGWGNGGSGGQEMNFSMGTCCPSSSVQNNFISYFLGDREEQLAPDVITAEAAFANTTSWQYAVVAVRDLDTSPHAEIFLNGTSIATNTGVTGAFTDRSLWNTNLRIGRPGAAARLFNGQIDEVRISDAVRSSDWICTEYNNQNSPSAFFTLINHPPDLATIEAAPLNFTEGGVASPVTATMTASDWDNATFNGAVIQITSNYVNGEDVLSFTNAFGITGSWDASSGTLTLSGSATIANYQTALRSITFQNTNTFNPSTLARTISFTVNDGTDDSNTISRNVTITSTNDAPVLAAIEVPALAYSEGQAATVITSSTTVVDDNINIASASVRITANFVSAEDVLAFTNAFGITGTYTAATGILALTGSASVADYEAALRTVTYRNSNNNAPSTLTRTVSFTVNDGTVNSNTITRTITIAAVNDAPVLSAIEAAPLNFAEGALSAAITGTINIVDVDNANITGATVQITNNYVNGEDVLSFVSAFGLTGTFDAPTGTMTITGTTTVANYRTAIRSVRYQNTNGNNPSGLQRTVTFTVTDGVDNSNTQSRNINVVPSNDVPVLAAIEGATLAYSEGDPATIITSTTTVSDVDNTNIASASIRITGNYQNGQDLLEFTSAFGITATFTAANGTLALAGSASLADYQSALQQVTYRNTNNNNPSALTRTVSFTVNDGSGNSNTLTRTITFTAVNDAPVLASTEAAALNYAEGQAATAVTSATTVTDVDNANIAGAVIQITGNYLDTEDVLTFTTVSGITGAFDALTGTMTLTGTSSSGNYQNAIRTVRYQNTNTNNPSTLTRTVSFTVNDGTANSNTTTRNINVTGVNDASVLANIEPATMPYTEEQAPTAITSSITIADVDNSTIASATAQITGNYQNGQDVLAFVSAFGITSSFNTTSGTLTLTGPASLADFQTALQLVTYQNTNTINPSTTTRTVTFRVNDGTANSNTQARTITFTAVNDAPVLAAIEGTDLAYSEGQAATVITGSTTVVDGDNTNLAGATIQITGNFLASEDLLSFTNAFSITGSYDAPTGTMTLAGNTTVANYQSAIRSIRYRNSNNATPSPLTRTVSFTVRDAALNSNTVTRNIAVTPVNDPPTVVNDPVSTNEENAIVINALTNDSDMDDTIDPTTVTIVTGPANGTATVDAITGEITYTPALNFSGTNTIVYNVKDVAGSTSANATITITVNNINDAPSFVVGADQTVNEDAGTQTVVGWATGMDDGDPFTAQTLTFVLTNTNNALFATQPAVNATNGTLTFRSNNNAVGTATVTISLRDNGSSTAPNVNLSATQTFTITVLPLNDPPNAVADFYSTSSNTPLTANLRSNDTDPESNALTVSTTPAVNPGFGTVVISSNGNFTYTPNGTFTGEDTFTYEVCDNGTDNGVPASRCSQAVVTVTINPPNPHYNIVGNNSIQLSTHCFILTKALNNQQGAVWNRTPLDIRYSFDLNFETMYSDTGVVKDVGADGIIFVLQRDDTPPPLNVPGSPIDARGSVGEYLGVGGVSPSIGIEVDTYQNAGEPAYDHIAISKNGSVYNIISPAVPAKVDATATPLNIEDGVSHTVRISWDKPTNTLRVYFDGEERTNFTEDIINTIFAGDPTNIYWGFSSSTGGQNNYQAVCGIDMLPINLPATAVDDVITTDEDVAVGGNLLSNDFDPEGGAITAVAETKATAHGNVVINADGTFTYTPVADYNGSDSFTYQVCDAYSTPGCNTATMVVTVQPTTDNPFALADNYLVDEDNVLTVPAVGVLINDGDVDGDVITASLVAGTSSGSIALNPDGSFTYTPAANFNGSDNFTYRTNDGVNNSSTVTVGITVNAVNDAPVAADDNVTTNEDTALAIMVFTNDNDIDNSVDPGSITIMSMPAHGTLSLNPTTGVIAYTPASDYNGNDSFTYTIEDVFNAVSNTATVSITVEPVNDGPVANNDMVSTSEDVAASITVSANDFDIDNALDLTKVVLVAPASHGITSVDPATGVITYTPTLNYFGNDSFTYTIKDVSGVVSNVATVDIEITSFNDRPVAVNDNAVTLQDTAVPISILLNDSDVDDAIDVASIIIVQNPSNGSLTIDNLTGVVTYTPASGYLGSDSFIYAVNDLSGGSSNDGEVSILVVPPNQPPVAVDDLITHTSLLSVTIDVMANDSDPDNTLDELSLISVTQPSIGTVSIVDGKVVYQPHGTEQADVTFTYTIDDPEGLTDVGTVTILYRYEPLVVSEGFSPNGDGNNDYWFIRSIDSYPSNSIKVFDRWGIVVYQIQNYDNGSVMWDGRANTGFESGKLLEQGTYFYTVDLGNETKPMSGYVVIVR